MKRYQEIHGYGKEMRSARVLYSLSLPDGGDVFTICFGYITVRGYRRYQMWEESTGLRVLTDIQRLNRWTFEKIAILIICKMPIREAVEAARRKEGA